MRMRRVPVVQQGLLLCLLAVGAPALAQSPGGDLPLTTLHVQAREVVLDVVVTDKHGNFVNGLKQEDFSILEDKKYQPIVAFQPPSMHAMPADAPEVKSTADLQKIGNAPVTILVLDELNTAFMDMAYARGALQKWLDRQPAKLTQPAVLLVASDEKFAVLHDFTQDRAALLLTLKNHFPSYPFKMSKGGSIGPDAGERLGMSLSTLVQIAQASSGTPGRKNVIWVGVGFPQLLLDDVSGSKEDDITKAAVRATDAMLKARVTLNVIDPTAMADSSLDLNNPDYLTLDTLSSVSGPTSATISGYLNFDTFAPATGGALYAGRNDVDREIDQAVNNGSNYYTLAYRPTNPDDNPAKFRNIQIVMRDPSLLATTRTGYFPEVQPKPGEAPPPPATHDLAFDLISAALSSITYNGVKVEPQKTAQGYILHTKLAELSPHILADGTNLVEVTVMRVCFGNKNKVLSHDPFELQSKIPPGTTPVSAAFLVPGATLPKGTVRIRFVVRDAISGHIGTADVADPQ
jgi:VWFA-related protein